MTDSADSLDQHLQRLAEVGQLESQGHFTVAQDRVWESLNSALDNDRALVRFAARWLIKSGAQKITIETTSLSRRLLITADLNATSSQQFETLSRGSDLDYAGSDIDLARAVVSAKKAGAKSIGLRLEDGALRWTRDFSKQDPWSKEQAQGAPRARALLELVLGPFSAASKAWQSALEENFHHSPIPILWNGKRVDLGFSLKEPILVWRHLLPREGPRSTAAFRPPHDCLETFRIVRFPQTEVIMGLGRAQHSCFVVLRHGDRIAWHRQDFLPGFQVLVRDSRLNTSVDGLRVAETGELKSLLQALREEALDMLLQLYRLEPEVEPKRLLDCLEAVEAVLLHLLDQKRWTEGYRLMAWLRNRLNVSNRLLAPEQAYTLYRLGTLLAEPAGHPGVTQLWMKHARELSQSVGQQDRSFAVKTLLIDAHLEFRSRRGEKESLSADTRSRLHLAALREHREGRFEPAYRLMHTLARSFPAKHDQGWLHLLEAAILAEKAGHRSHALKIRDEFELAKQGPGFRVGRDLRQKAEELAEVLPGVR